MHAQVPQAQQDHWDRPGQAASRAAQAQRDPLARAASRAAQVELVLVFCAAVQCPVPSSGCMRSIKQLSAHPSLCVHRAAAISWRDIRDPGCSLEAELHAQVAQVQQDR
jgi:hypothetical protein